MTHPDRRADRRAEIERDHQMVVMALRVALRRIARDAEPAVPDVERVWGLVEDALERIRSAFRRLNDARINQRGQRRARFDDSHPFPPCLRNYRHHGNYHGFFPSMVALGVALRRIRDVPEDRTIEGGAASIAHKLHLRGELWTFELGGLVHVFAPQGSPSDAALALLQPTQRPGLGPQAFPDAPFKS